MTVMNADNSVMTLATRFADKGDWTVEQQFVLQMGSSYLLAHGIGTPLTKDARTTIEIAKDGKYTMYVRTKNWTRFWSDAPTPGVFQVQVDGKADKATFGTGESASTGKVGTGWCWQKGGTYTLTKGKHEIALHDLTGFDGRCDAIIFTTAKDSSTRKPAIPGDSLEEYKQLRDAILGPVKPVDKGNFDFVIVGAGISGICAALAAARLGCTVALIQDRYILGGNNSSEVRVGVGGRINVDPYPSLGYLMNEFCPDHIGNARGAEHYQDWKKMDIILKEKNVTLFSGYSVVQAMMEQTPAKTGKPATKKIKSIIAVEATTQEAIRISGYTFSDCTGDAYLAVLAGAETRMGREAKAEFNEKIAPEKADGFTMGASLQWYCEDWNTPCTFPDAMDWGLDLDEITVEPVHRANWYWEVGMNDDQIEDSEKIRDYGMYVAYSTFSYCKNHFSKREDWVCTHLTWVSHVAGKRESRRIVGDYILNENDLVRRIPHEDATCTTTWRIDQHYPMKENGERYPGAEWISVGRLTPIDPYPLPYRCFYSKDIDNMFMAGRDISVTHIAFGSIRVMRTCGMMGEVVGMAASICHKRKVLPRDIYKTYFEDLKALMRKGTGNTDVPYTQFYHQVDRVGNQAEDR